jgi:hypothetical protein
MYQGNSYLLSKTPYSMERPAPCFGELNAYIGTQIPGN